MSVLIPEKVAQSICGAERPGVVDDVCREKVSEQYDQYTEGLNDMQQLFFDLNMMKVMMQASVPAKAREIEQRLKTAEDKANLACEEKQEFLLGEIYLESQISASENCTEEKLTNINIDTLLGAFRIFDAKEMTFTNLMANLGYVTKTYIFSVHGDKIRAIASK